jgi:hypothetical protein
MHKHGRCTPAATTVSGWLAVWVGVRKTQVLAAYAYALSLHMCPARMHGVLWGGGGEMAIWSWVCLHSRRIHQHTLAIEATGMLAPSGSVRVGSVERAAAPADIPYVLCMQV